MSDAGHQTWPELAADLYDKLTGRKAEITYEFENVEVGIPSAVGAAAGHANWRVNGALKIRTRDLGAE